MPSPRVALWRDRFSRFAAGAGSSAMLTLASVIRIKWLAMHFDAAGIGILGQVLNAQTWLGTGSSMVLGVPLAQDVAAADAAGDADRVRRAVWTAGSLAAGIASTAAALGVLFAPQVSTAILGTPEHAPLVRVSMVGVLGIALYAIVSGLFAGRSDVRSPLTLSLAGGLGSVAVTLALVPRAGLAGGVVGGVVALPLGIAVALWWHRRRYGAALAPIPRPPLDRTLARRYLGVSLIFVTLSVIEQGSMLAMRSHVVRAHGVATNGLLQAALSLTQQLGAFFYVYLSGYAFGRVSASPGAAAIRDYTRRQWTPIMLLAVVVFGVAMLASGPMLHLFYSDRFDGARPMMDWLMVGELAKVGLHSWIVGALPLGGPWLAAMLLVPYSLTTAAVYAVLVSRGGGPLDLPHAYAISGGLGLALAALIMGARGVRMRARDAAVGIVGVAALGLLAWSRSR